MTPDMRNSIIAWVSVILLAGYFWAVAHFGLTFPEPWATYVLWLGLSLVLLDLVWRGWRYWKRRSGPAPQTEG